jgi:hypothetical protein
MALPLIKGILTLLGGLLLIHVGWRHWRFRHQETVSWLEAQLLSAVGEEPLPRSRSDRFLTYLQAGLGITLGSTFAFLGVVIILGELDLL